MNTQRKRKETKEKRVEEEGEDRDGKKDECMYTMPSFFQFTQGTESRTRPASDASPLLGRFRAVPPPPLNRRPSTGALGLLSSALGNGRGSVHGGYGALLAAEFGNDDAARTAFGDHSDDDDHDNVNGGRRSRGRTWQRLWRKTVDLWIEPRQAAVKRVVDAFWSRYLVLVILPAALVCLFDSTLNNQHFYVLVRFG